MLTSDEILDKLVRKRAFALERSKKFYNFNKENVLNKQKDARLKFNEEVVKANRKEISH